MKLREICYALYRLKTFGYPMPRRTPKRFQVEGSTEGMGFTFPGTIPHALKAKRSEKELNRRVRPYFLTGIVLACNGGRLKGSMDQARRMTDHTSVTRVLRRIAKEEGKKL